MIRYNDKYAIEAVCLVIREGKISNRQLAEYFHVKPENVREWKEKHKLFRWAVDYGVLINNIAVMDVVTERLNTGNIGAKEIESLAKIGIVNFGLSEEAQKRIKLEKIRGIMARWKRGDIDSTLAHSEFELENIQTPKILELALEQDIKKRMEAGRSENYAESVRVILDDHFKGVFDFDQSAMLLEKVANVENGWKTLDRVYQQRERQKQRDERVQSQRKGDVVQFKAN